MLCTGENIQTYLKKKKKKEKKKKGKCLIFSDSSKMLTKISPKMQNLGQSDPLNCFLLIACSKFVPKSIYQLAGFQFQK